MALCRRTSLAQGCTVNQRTFENVALRDVHCPVARIMDAGMVTNNAGCVTTARDWNFRMPNWLSSAAPSAKGVRGTASSRTGSIQPRESVSDALYLIGITIGSVMTSHP